MQWYTIVPAFLFLFDLRHSNPGRRLLYILSLELLVFRFCAWHPGRLSPPGLPDLVGVKYSGRSLGVETSCNVSSQPTLIRIARHMSSSSNYFWWSQHSKSRVGCGHPHCTSSLNTMLLILPKLCQSYLWSSKCLEFRILLKSLPNLSRVRIRTTHYSVYQFHHS
jgi:hypothetical protein